MTDIETRRPSLPVTINAEFTETTVAPGEITYRTNPYLIGLTGSAAGLLIAGAGTAWQLYRDNANVEVAFALLLAAMFAVTYYWRAFWTWDAACAVGELTTGRPTTFGKAP